MEPPSQHTGEPRRRWHCLDAEHWTFGTGAPMRNLAHPGFKATYSAGGRGWYVLTGYIGGRQFYSRARVERGGLVAFAVTYDSALEHTVEPAIVAMSSSFARPHILSMIEAPVP